MGKQVGDTLGKPDMWEPYYCSCHTRHGLEPTRSRIEDKPTHIPC